MGNVTLHIDHRDPDLAVETTILLCSIWMVGDALVPGLHIGAVAVVVKPDPVVVRQTFRDPMRCVFL